MTKSKQKKKAPGKKPTVKIKPYERGKKAKAKKNLSKKIPKGRTVRTRDEFFEGQGNYKKPGYENAGNYRKAAVVDSNEFDELALVKLYGYKKGRKGFRLKNYQQGNSMFRPYVVILDDDNNPIAIGNKFVECSPSEDLSKKDVAKIHNYLFKQSNENLRKENSKKISKLKRRRK